MSTKIIAPSSQPPTTWDETLTMIDNWIMNSVVQPLHDAGYENLGPIVGSALSTAKDVVPTHTEDMTTAAALGPAAKALKGAPKAAAAPSEFEQALAASRAARANVSESMARKPVPPSARKIPEPREIENPMDPEEFQVAKEAY